MGARVSGTPAPALACAPGRTLGRGKAAGGSRPSASRPEQALAAGRAVRGPCARRRLQVGRGKPVWAAGGRAAENAHTTGYCFTKPELIFTLEQGEDPWLLKKEFLGRSSPEESQLDQFSERSLENQGKHLWQVLFTNKALTTEQEILGKPCKLAINIFPARSMPCKCNTTRPSYLYLSSLASHCQCSREKARELNVCEKWLLSIKEGRSKTGEKPFIYRKNVKAFSHEEEGVPHQTIKTLQQAFEYNECGKAFLKETSLSSSKSIHPKVKLHKFSKSGEKQCDKSTPIVSHGSNPQKSHCEFNDYEYTENRNNLSRIPQRTDPEGKSLSQTSHIREHQKIHTEVKPSEYGNSFRHNSALPVHQRAHMTDKSFDYDTCTRTLGYQSTLNVHHRTHITVKTYECNECGKSCSMNSHLIQPQECHTGEKPYECHECGKAFSEKS
ncbi:hypothetical protein MC885_003904, partial [Smutsia gigantea]